MSYTRKYAEEHKDHIKEKAKEWIKNNRERVRERQRKNYSKNKEHIRKIKNEYMKAHKDEYNEKARIKYSQNLSENQRYGKEYRERNKEHRKDIALKYNFGITLDDYHQLLDEQNGKCAICGIDQKDASKMFAVDHNHETGQIRGLLCLYCNRMLGDAKDNIESLRKAIEYLEKWSSE